ncbi:MAG: peptidase S10, partial [Terriglobales bacterium]
MKNPLPADKSAPQTITIGGKTIHYTATVGTITLKGNDEKPNGVVMYTAYTLDEPKGDKGPTHRPVTFALNGGPGASSVYLNLGAIGPKHIVFANEGDSPSDPAT